MHGKGKIKYKNGDLYEGDFFNGIKHGQGVYKFKLPNGRTYNGQFQIDTITGFGIMEFEEKKMIYEGNFLNGAMCGKGKMVFANGVIYEGEWNED